MMLLCQSLASPCSLDVERGVVQVEQLRSYFLHIQHHFMSLAFAGPAALPTYSWTWRKACPKLRRLMHHLVCCAFPFGACDVCSASTQSMASKLHCSLKRQGVSEVTGPCTASQLHGLIWECRKPLMRQAREPVKRRAPVSTVPEELWVAGLQCASALLCDYVAIGGRDSLYRPCMSKQSDHGVQGLFQQHMLW